MTLAHSSAEGGASIPGGDAVVGEAYLLASRKHTLRGHRYITFWRADRCGYAWALPWAGRYGADEADLISDAPTSIYRDEHTYAVPLSVIEPLCVSPKLGDIDGNVGPVLRNTKAHWAVIEAHAAILKATTAPEAGAVGTTEGREPQSPTTREGADR